MIVIVESPYSHADACRYLACCLLDSILRGEAPIASHALYPLALPEHCESYGGRTGREIGLSLRDELAGKHVCVRYVDLGITPGMQRPGRYIPDRTLEGEARRIWEASKWPTRARLTKNH
jgi:hypothetical protein